MRSAMRSGTSSTLGDAEREYPASAVAAGEAGRKRMTHEAVVVVGCGAKIAFGELDFDSKQPSSSSSEVEGVSGGLLMPLMLLFLAFRFRFRFRFRSAAACVVMMFRVVVLDDIAVLSLGKGPVSVPVRIADGRVCSKPWVRATCSMLLKYCV